MLYKSQTLTFLFNFFNENSLLNLYSTLVLQIN
jgi:hypothetical protein